MSEEVGLFKKYLLEKQNKAKNLNHFHLRTTRWKFQTNFTRGLSFSFLTWKKPLLAGIVTSIVLDYYFRYNISEH